MAVRNLPRGHYPGRATDTWSCGVTDQESDLWLAHIAPPSGAAEDHRHEAAESSTSGKPGREIPERSWGDPGDHGADTSENRPLVREEFPTAVYDGIELLDAEIKNLRHQLECIPSGHSAHGKPIDQYCFVIQRTPPPPHITHRNSQELEYGARKEAAKTYATENAVRASKRDRCATL